MAQSRLEKIGTIYSRVTSLIKAGALKEENRPFWLDVYAAFPPKYEPTFDRPGSTAPVRKIFYAEDLIRARFHREFKHLSMVNLLDNNSVSKSEQFLTIYKRMEKEGIPEVERYDKAVDEFLSKVNSEKLAKKAENSETVPKSVSLKRQKTEINIQELLSEDTENNTKFKPIRLSMDKLQKDVEDDLEKTK